MWFRVFDYSLTKVNRDLVLCSLGFLNCSLNNFRHGKHDFPCMSLQQALPELLKHCSWKQSILFSPSEKLRADLVGAVSLEAWGSKIYDVLGKNVQVKNQEQHR